MARPRDPPRPAVRALVLGLVLGAVGALAAAALAGVAYVVAGGFNVAASVPHSRLTYWATKTMMDNSVKRRAGRITAPAAFSRAEVVAGYRTYEARCRGCHGAPNLGERDAGLDDMTPVPPYLVGAAQEFTPAELYWIIRYGVKMTGMPAWDRTCSEAEVWQLVAFLEAMPRLDATAYRDLRAQAAAAAPTPACSGPRSSSSGGGGR